MSDVANQPRMVRIPAGEVSLRDDRKGKRWILSIDSFLLCETPLTQALYRSMTGLAPSRFTGDQRPVESISWYEAVTFCNSLSKAQALDCAYAFGDEPHEVTMVPGSKGFRLPTDGEWEYAAKAGSPGPRYGALEDIAWFEDNAGAQTHDVRGKEPNPWGLYDMLGNVWEWCWDLYDPEVYGEYRVFRGGGWADGERGCFATNRRRSHPTFKIDDLGFRLARSL